MPQARAPRAWQTVSRACATAAAAWMTRLVCSSLLATASVSVSACVSVPGAPYVRTVGTTSASTLDGRSIRVLVWNIYKSKLDGWRGDFVALAARHDLLLLQEGYWDDDWTSAFASAPGVQWWMGVTFEYLHESPRPTTGTVLGSRSGPLSPVLCFHSPYREAFVGTPKSHIEATFTVTGSPEPLLAVSVHATNLHPDEDAFDAHMRRIFRRVSLHDGPVVLAGDFNTWTESRTATLFALAQQLGLTSVFPHGPADDQHDDGRTSWNDNYLDHAFTRGLSLRAKATVLAHIDSSDHKPLSFEVAVSNPR